MNMVSPVATAAYYPEFNISISINLKSVRALIIRLRGMPDFDLDTSELDERVRQFEGKLDFMAETISSSVTTSGNWNNNIQRSSIGNPWTYHRLRPFA